MSANTETHSAGIADVLASVPLMLGAIPRNATVVMAFKNQILVLTAQVHHGQGGITEALDKTMRVSAQHGCDAVLCAAYGMNQEEAAWSAECAANAAEDHSLQIMAQVHVEPNLRMYSDAAGHWHQLPTVQESQTLAVHAANHPSPADSMEDLTAE